MDLVIRFFIGKFLLFIMSCSYIFSWRTSSPSRSWAPTCSRPWTGSSSCSALTGRSCTSARRPASTWDSARYSQGPITDQVKQGRTNHRPLRPGTAGEDQSQTTETTYSRGGPITDQVQQGRTNHKPLRPGTAGKDQSHTRYSRGGPITDQVQQWRTNCRPGPAGEDQSQIRFSRGGPITDQIQLGRTNHSRPPVHPIRMHRRKLYTSNANTSTNEHWIRTYSEWIVFVIFFQWENIALCLQSVIVCPNTNIIHHTLPSVNKPIRDHIASLSNPRTF